MDSDNHVSPEAVIKVKADGQTQRFLMAADELITIGRASSCQIQIQHKSVSREHCVAVYTNGKICINDLRSTHGITFQGERVNRCELSPGQNCHLGNALATFEAKSTPHEAEQATTPSTKSTPSEATAASPAPEVTTVEGLVPKAAESADQQVESAKELDRENPLREIAGYRVLNKIGEGGFGLVYRAEQVRLGREVALKVLKRDENREDDKERIEAFLREARVAAGLSDPRLVQIYDVGESDGEHFLSMELVAGGSLSRKLKRDGPMDWQSVIRLLRDISHALKAAHAAGLVHRDVKPGNILMASNGQAKLTDLGLAANDTHAGTIAFMAPEQLRREPVDQRADIYALGCTAYAALAGNPPFTGDKKAIAQAQLKQQPASLLDRNVQVPWHLHQLIIDSMLAKDPSDRPQTASAIIERLDRMILPINVDPAHTEDDSLDYPSVAPQKLERPTRIGSSPPNPQKQFLARLAADTIIFVIVGATIIGLLLMMKAIWPSADIYRLIGRGN